MKNRFCWIIVSIITISFLFNFTGCSEPEVPHEHKYADLWEYDETYHWKPAICEHKSEFSERDYYYYGKELYRNKKYKKAIVYLKKFLSFKNIFICIQFKFIIFSMFEK